MDLLGIIDSSTRLGEATRRVYRDAVRRFELFAGGERSGAAVQRFRDHLLTEIIGRMGKPRKPQTAYKMLAGLRYASRRFADLGLGADFARAAEMPARPAWMPRDGLDLDEARAVRQVCAADPSIRGLRDLGLVDVALVAAALRVAEIETLAVGAYHARDHLLDVARKGGWTQHCYLDAGTCRVLDTWIDVRRGRPGDPLFVSLHPSTTDRPLLGEGLSSAGIRHIIAGRAAEAGIARRITPHVLRHTWFGLGLRAGLSLERLSLAAGHRRPAAGAPAVAARYRHDLLAREQPVGVAIRALLEGHEE